MPMFKVGDPVIHPSHGLGFVEEIREELVAGRRMGYYVIDFPLNEIDKIMVPVTNAENLGLRPVVEEYVIDEVLRILTETEESFLDALEDETFHKRHKEYVDRVQSGDVLEVARVFKTLYERARLKDLGLKEKFLMERAEKILLGEISVVKGISLDGARKILSSGRF